MVYRYVRCQVFTAVRLPIVVSWVVTPYNLVGCYQRFGWSYRLHLQVDNFTEFNAEDRNRQTTCAPSSVFFPSLTVIRSIGFVFTFYLRLYSFHRISPFRITKFPLISLSSFNFLVSLFLMLLSSP
jgi:hypothetical protein